MINHQQHLELIYPCLHFLRPNAKMNLKCLFPIYHMPYTFPLLSTNIVTQKYKISIFKGKFNELDDKRIAIYGTGVNARVLVSLLEEFEVICIIAENEVNKYYYGKKVLSLEDALYLGIDTIIIAAELYSEMVVKNRIYDFCVKNGISLRNMFGLDYLDIWRRGMHMDMDYQSISYKNIENEINKANAICIELMGGLYESSFFCRTDMWKYIENTHTIESFEDIRAIVEEEYDHRQPYRVETLYDNYMVKTYCPADETKKLLHLEEKVFEENLIIKKRMSEIIKMTYRKGKRIIVFTMLPYSEILVRKIITRAIGDVEYSLVHENTMGKTLSKGLFRQVLGLDMEKTTLYIGQMESIGFYLAQCYDLNPILIKDSLEMMSVCSDYVFDTNHMDLDKRRSFKSWCAREYNSFLFDDVDDIEAETWDEDIQEEEKEIDIIPLIESENILDFEKLKFPIFDNPKISIIIPAYNHFADTYRCLSSILKNTMYVEYEVIIADDNSTDLTKMVSQIISGIRIVRNDTNLRFLKNCNNASSYAKGKYILFLNNDTQVRLNWLFPLFHIMENDNTIGLAGSKLIGADGLVQEAGGVVFRDGSAINYGRGMSIANAEINYVREVDYISGASIMINADLWREIGGFDERYAPAYCEDSDLAFEVRKKGFRVVYQPASEVIHFEGVSNGTDVSDGDKRYQTVNERKLREKWQDVLRSHYDNNREDYFKAHDRKYNKKTILFISTHLPTYDKDAGSKTIYMYLRLFQKKGFLVKFWPINDYPTQPYTHELQQLGIHVIYRQGKKKISNWVMKNAKDIDYAFINYPNVANEVIDMINLAGIRVRYYGHDLHYLRLKREYELNGNNIVLHESNVIHTMEKNAIEKSEYAYYPSDNEVKEVRKEFHKNNVRRLIPYLYDSCDTSDYHPTNRSGMMFIGGTHSPNEDAVKWFLEKVYPKVCERMSIPFYIVGANRIEQKRMNDNWNVICTGYLTEQELIDMYHKIRMVVIPLRYGAGVKGKLVDALYHGVPVITTDIGAEGVDEEGRVVSITNNEELFAEEICRLYIDEKKLENMSTGGKELVKMQFSFDAAWKRICNDFI